MNPIHSLWRPQSHCGSGCLPGPGETPTVSVPRRAGRLAALFGTLLLGAALVAVLPVLPRSGRHAAGRGWARTVLWALGIGLVVHGRLPGRRVLLVANHISWLDVVTVLSVTPARMLAKHEVRRWPLIGPLAAVGGAIFVDRTRPRTLPATVARVATALRAGGMVAVFPEGTTWCGVPRVGAGCSSAGRFRPAMFQAAIDAEALIVPVNLGYRVDPRRAGLRDGGTGGGTGGGTRGGGTTAPAFLAEENLWASVRRVLAVRGLVVSLTVTGPLRIDDAADRRWLAGVAESAVRAVRSPVGPSGTSGPPPRSGSLELAA